MRLLAFNIKNYRSIIDTGWNSLAPDNITALIGQNESGKTSILCNEKSLNSAVSISDWSMNPSKSSFSKFSEKISRWAGEVL